MVLVHSPAKAVSDGVFFFSSRRRHTRCSRDWSSDVCSSDLHDAIEVEAVMRLQVVRERGGAKRAVAFTDEKFRRVPAVVAADIRVDELRQGFNVLIDAPEILVLGFADGVAEASADR